MLSDDTWEPEENLSGSLLLCCSDRLSESLTDWAGCRVCRMSRAGQEVQRDHAGDSQSAQTLTIVSQYLNHTVPLPLPPRVLSSSSCGNLCSRLSVCEI